MVKEKTTEAKLARLAQLANKAGEALFERAGIAVDVLNDAEWIASVFKGDIAEAEELVAADYFPDMIGVGWFGKLLVLRRTYTDISHWRQFRFSLQRLWVDHQEKVAVTTPSPASDSRPRVTRKQFEDVKEELDSAQYQLRRQKEIAAKLEGRCHDLERELSEAKGRIETLESILDHYMQEEPAVA